MLFLDINLLAMKTKLLILCTLLLIAGCAKKNDPGIS